MFAVCVFAFGWPCKQLRIATETMNKQARLLKLPLLLIKAALGLCEGILRRDLG